MYYANGFCAGRQYKEIPPKIYPGGKGVNVARVMTLLGEHCVLYMFAGGRVGEMIVEDMRNQGVELRVFPLEGETRTTINIIDRALNMETEITEPGPSIGDGQEEQFLQTLREETQENDIVVCSGIPLPGMSRDIFRKISEICRERRAKCVLDANSVYLQASFPAEYEMVKPNYDELRTLNHSDLPLTDENLILLGRKTMEKGAGSLLVSTGAQGGVLMCREAIYKASFPAQTDIKSTIGSGDSTVAGYCVAMQRGMPAQEALRFAMACGICNAKFSRVGYVDNDMVRELLDVIRIETLSKGGQNPCGD